MADTGGININSGSYAQFENLDQFSYNCVKYLMEQDEVIWKLLYYKTPDAWSKANLSQSEKASLIYDGSDNTAPFSVFMDIGSPDVVSNEASIIRISPYSITPENRTVATVAIMFEVYCHYKLNHLSNYTVRTDVIMKRFIQVFNGAHIGGLGRLFFDRMASDYPRMDLAGQLPYRGKWLIMATKSG
jgi:hypothetical protein